MTFSEREIIKTIDKHVQRLGGKYSEWYVGICKNTKQKTSKNVEEDTYIALEAENDRTTKAMQRLFTDFFGMKTCPDNVYGNSRYIYVYKIKKDEK